MASAEKGFCSGQRQALEPQGSSIAEVYLDALELYDEVLAGLSPIIATAIAALGAASGASAQELCVANTTPWTRHEVLCLSAEEAATLPSLPHTQQAHDGSCLVEVHVEPGVATVEASAAVAASKLETLHPATAEAQSDGSVVLQNGVLRAKIEAGGLVSSLLHLGTGRECVMPGAVGANSYLLFEDLPLSTDGWDIDRWTQEKVFAPPATSATVADASVAEAEVVASAAAAASDTVQLLESGPLRAAVRCAVRISSQSWLSTIISLDAGSDQLQFDCEAEWRESHQLLRAEFPIDVLPHQGVASFEIQYGHAARPNHRNTSWDVARFEVCAQRWADLSEHGFGVSLLNDCKHGHSVEGSVLSLSLLRAPKTPDPTADMGHHCARHTPARPYPPARIVALADSSSPRFSLADFSYALRPHEGSPLEAKTTNSSVNFTSPLLTAHAAANTAPQEMPAPIFRCDTDGVILDAVKRAEDGDGIIVRLYEANGGRATAVVQTSAQLSSAARVDLLENPLTDPVRAATATGLPGSPENGVQLFG